jgi:RNA polymerase sigma-70 factor (ECF subfamily)
MGALLEGRPEAGGGSVESFESVFRDYSPGVEALCRHVLGDSQDAEHAIEETFLRAQQALPQYNGQPPLEEWIERIAASVCADYLRSHRGGE